MSVCMFWRREKSPTSSWNQNVVRMSSVPQPNHYTDCPSTALHISKDEFLRMNNKTIHLILHKVKFKLKILFLWGLREGAVG